MTVSRKSLLNTQGYRSKRPRSSSKASLPIWRTIEVGRASDTTELLTWLEEDDRYATPNQRVRRWLAGLPTQSERTTVDLIIVSASELTEVERPMFEDIFPNMGKIGKLCTVEIALELRLQYPKPENDYGQLFIGMEPICIMAEPEVITLEHSFIDPPEFELRSVGLQDSPSCTWILQKP